MFLNRRFHTVLLFLVATVLQPTGANAQAPLIINGPTDRQILTDIATVNVPSMPGHTYSVLIDGQLLPTDVNHVVNRADYHEVSVTRTNLESGAVTNRIVRFI